MPCFGYQHDGDEMIYCKLWLLIFYFFSCKAERLFFWIFDGKCLNHIPIGTITKRKTFLNRNVVMTTVRNIKHVAIRCNTATDIFLIFLLSHLWILHPSRMSWEHCWSWRAVQWHCHWHVQSIMGETIYSPFSFPELLPFYWGGLYGGFFEDIMNWTSKTAFSLPYSDGF